MSTSWRFAAWMIVSPANAEIVSPFSLKSMVSAAAVARSFSFIRSDLVREVLRDAANRIRGSLAQAADRRVGHRDRELLEELLVPFLRLHQLGRLRGADPARRALPARLVLEEAHQVHRRVARAVVLRE